MIYLVSQSPRRREILTRLKIPFEVRDSGYEEVMESHLSSRLLVRKLAKGKVEAYLSRHPQTEYPVLGADTLLSFQGRSLGKAKNRAEARTMLQSLRGHCHFVFTALCLGVPGEKRLRCSVTSTRVEFRQFTDLEMEDYLNTGEWEGAAGSYRIQETGERLIKGIKGSWSNVVGLPIPALYDILSGT